MEKAPKSDARKMSTSPSPVRVKEEPADDIKDFAENTMNELLGWYGYDKVDSRDTKHLDLQRYTSQDAAEKDGARRDSICSSTSSEDSMNHTKSMTTSPNSGSGNDLAAQHQSLVSALNKTKGLTENLPSGYILCAWCQKPGVKLFTLKTSGGSKAFCSELCFTQCRRASFKKNKVCDWCKHVRHTVNYVDFQDGEQQLQFCSNKCLNQYKMNIFCRETQEHLQQIQTQGDGGALTNVKTSSSGQILITPELWMDRPQRENSPDSLTQDSKSSEFLRNNDNKAKKSVPSDGSNYISDDDDDDDDLMDFDDENDDNSNNDSDDTNRGCSSRTYKREGLAGEVKERYLIDREGSRQVYLRETSLTPLSVTTSPSPQISTPVSVTSNNASPLATHSLSPPQLHPVSASGPSSMSPKITGTAQMPYQSSLLTGSKGHKREHHKVTSPRMKNADCIAGGSDGGSGPIPKPSSAPAYSVTSPLLAQMNASTVHNPPVMRTPTQPMFAPHIPPPGGPFSALPLQWMMGGNPMPPAVIPGSILMVPCPIPIPIPIPIPFPFPMKDESCMKTSSGSAEKAESEEEPAAKIARHGHGVEPQSSMDKCKTNNKKCGKDQICCASCQTERHQSKIHISHTAGLCVGSGSDSAVKLECIKGHKAHVCVTDSECSLITSSSDIEETAIDLSKDKNRDRLCSPQPQALPPPASVVLPFPLRGSQSIFSNSPSVDQSKNNTAPVNSSPLPTPPLPTPPMLVPMSTPPGIVLTCPPTHAITSNLPPPADHAYSSRRGRILDAPSVPRQRSPSPSEKRILLRNSSRDFLHKRRCLRTRIKTK